MTYVTVRCPLEDCSRTFSLSGQEPFQLVYLQLWEHVKAHNYDEEDEDVLDDREQGLKVLLNHVGERLV